MPGMEIGSESLDELVDSIDRAEGKFPVQDRIAAVMETEGNSFIEVSRLLRPRRILIICGVSGLQDRAILMSLPVAELLQHLQFLCLCCPRLPASRED